MAEASAVKTPSPDPEIDVLEHDDSDSAAGDLDLQSSTASLSSSIMKFRDENGRTYHSYKEGKYMLPNDEREKDRLDLQHHLFTLTFDGKLFTCDVDKGRKQIHRVLDAGCGTGIWAIDFGDEHPESEVLGIDLSPIQPAFIPPNVSFQVDDLEQDWLFATRFDFIYARMLTGSIKDWPLFFKNSYNNLNPGGYVELADKCFPLLSDDGTLLPTSPLQQWSDFTIEGTGKVGRSIAAATDFKKQLEEAGFINIVETRYKWPINTWPKDPKFKQLGLWTNENLAPSLEGFSMAVFTRVLGWKKEEVETFLVQVRNDMKNTKIHAYLPIYVVSGQKPPE